MLWMVDTPVVANYDCDILLPKTSYPYAVNMILNGHELEDGTKYYPKCVYPYGEGTYQAQLYTNDEEVTKFINQKFDFEVFQKWRAYDAKFGFVQFFDTEEYKRLGGENEGFIAYGYEDDERFYRFNMLSKVARMNERIFHLEHKRTSNSWFNNPKIEANRSLWEKLKGCGKDELDFYYKNAPYVKTRNGQEQSST